MADLITTPDRSLLFITTGGKLAYKPAGATPVPRVFLPATAAVTEGATVSLTVALEFAHTSAVTVSYGMSNGTAFSGTDYTAVTGTVVIAAGQTTGTISVVTANRAGTQGSRTFFVTLTSAVDGAAAPITIVPGAGQTTVTILDGATAPVLSVAPVSEVDEGQTLTFRVSTPVTSATPITFSYTTAGGTAVAGTDYLTAAGSGGTIAAGALSTDIAVTTIARSGYQGPRTVGFTISNASVAIAVASALGRIEETEAPPAGSFPHFLARQAQPEHWFSEDLRSEASIARVVGSLNSTERTWQYVYGNDDYHDPQDGARFVMPHSLGPTNQIKFDLPTKIGTGTYVFGAEYWQGREFFYHLNSAVEPLVHKWMQFRSQGQSGAGIYCEPRCDYKENRTYPNIIQRDLRTYNLGNNSPFQSDVGEWGLRTNTPYDPTGAGGEPAESWVDNCEEWQRDIFEWRLNLPGTAFTDWMAAHSTSAYPLGTRDILAATPITRNTIQRIDLTTIQAGAGTNSVRLTFDGQTTDVISYTANVGGDLSAEIKAKLDALSNIDTVTVTRIGTTQRYDVEFQGTQANTHVSTLLHWSNAVGAKLDNTGKFCWLQRPGGACVEITTAAYAYWDDLMTLATTCTATIAGQTGGTINGTHDTVWVLSPTSLLIRGSSAGTGGTISKHFHMFSWWHMTETRGPVRLAYRVPMVREYLGQLARTDFEMNTSKSAESIKGWYLGIAPTVGTTTLITSTDNAGTPVAHGLTTGERVYLRGLKYSASGNTVGDGHHAVTVESPTTFTIPVTLTQPPVLHTSGGFNGYYGRVWRPLIGYVRNVWALYDATGTYVCDESDTATAASMFARP